MITVLSVKVGISTLYCYYLDLELFIGLFCFAKFRGKEAKTTVVLFLMNY